MSEAALAIDTDHALFPGTPDNHNRESRIATIAQLLRDGYNASDISRTLGLSRERIRQLVWAYGLRDLYERKTTERSEFNKEYWYVQQSAHRRLARGLAWALNARGISVSIERKRYQSEHFRDYLRLHETDTLMAASYCKARTSVLQGASYYRCAPQHRNIGQVVVTPAGHIYIWYPPVAVTLHVRITPLRHPERMRPSHDVAFLNVFSPDELNLMDRAKQT